MEDNNNNSQPANSSNDHHMPALTGIRFFAIFHIFLFHLVATSFGPKPEGAEDVLSGMRDMPYNFLVFCFNGWMSTSFFFLLSGFLLAYLYWGEDGQLVTSRRRFWSLRFARIYPIHLIVMAITIPVVVPFLIASGQPLTTIIPSAVATVTLVQAWVPPWIPHYNWPAWTISVLVFLYLIMPWLAKVLGRLSRGQMVAALVAMPFVSLIPTAWYAWRMTTGAEWNMNIDMFVANNPLFWVPYFAAGMLLTRIFGLSRFKPSPTSPSWIAWGDAALILVIGIAMTQEIQQPEKFLIRQGLLMPLFMIVVVDFARGRGFFAKLFSLPGTGFLGETGYSIFIWQGVVLISMVGAVIAAPHIGPYQHWIAYGLIMALAIPSTYLVEKPIARWIRRKYIDPLEKGAQR